MDLNSDRESLTDSLSMAKGQLDSSTKEVEGDLLGRGSSEPIGFKSDSVDDDFKVKVV